MPLVPRRRFLVAGSALVLMAPAAAAQVRQVKIGALAPRRNSIIIRPVLSRLRELGYVEGKNSILEYRSADGVVGRFPSLARELIAAKCDLILALGAEHPARALVDTKTRIPVVFLAFDYDPIKAGIVPNLQRPGGNVTGMVNPAATIAAKRLQLLQELMPAVRRVLVLADAFSSYQVDPVRQAARQLGVDLSIETFDARPYDFESAFARGQAAGIEAVSILNSPVFLDERSRIAALLMNHRVPAVSPNFVIEEAGYLIGYGVNWLTAYRRAGDIAAAILEGAKPGDIAVEQVTQFELVINLKTAKALDIAVPPAFALRADRMIQ